MFSRHTSLRPNGSSVMVAMPGQLLAHPHLVDVKNQVEVTPETMLESIPDVLSGSCDVVEVASAVGIGQEFREITHDLCFVRHSVRTGRVGPTP